MWLRFFAVAAVFILAPWGPGALPSHAANPLLVSQGDRFVRGNANDDGFLDASDASYILNFLFRNGPRPPCPDAADVNDDGKIDISDAQYLLNFLFKGGPRIPPPWPARDMDPTKDFLGCKSLPAGALNVAFLSTPASQTVFAGTKNFTAANLRLDASASPTDVLVFGLSVSVEARGVNAPAAVFVNLGLRDGLRRTPAQHTTCAADACRHQFFFSPPVSVAAGTAKIVAVSGDVASGAAGGSFTVAITPPDGVRAFGPRDETVEVAYGRLAGNQMQVVAAGGLTVTAVTQNHPAGLLPANTNGLEIGVFRFTAIREPIRVEKIVLWAETLRQVKAVHFYDGSTRLTPTAGVMPTAPDNRSLLIDLTANPLVVGLAGAKDILVKVDTQSVTRYPRASVGVPGLGIHFYLVAPSQVTARGERSGSILETITLNNATLNEWAVMSSVPTVTVHNDLPVAERLGGAAALPRLVAGSQKELYRFKVAADSAGDVYLYSVSLATDMHKATVTNPIIVVANTGQQVAATTTAALDLERTPNRLHQAWSLVFTSDGLSPTTTTYSPYRIPPGGSWLFVMKGDVACWTDNGCGTTNPISSLSVSFLGDYWSPSLYADSAPALFARIGSNFNHFIWSDASIMGPLGVASGTATTSEQWYNGFRVRSAVSPIGRLQPTTTDVTFLP